MKKIVREYSHAEQNDESRIIVMDILSYQRFIFYGLTVCMFKCHRITGKVISNVVAIAPIK